MNPTLFVDLFIAVTQPMQIPSSRFAIILLIVAACFAGPVGAQSLNVDIVGGTETATPIVVVPFDNGASST